MTKDSISKPSLPFGMIILTLIALALYVLLLVNAAAPRRSGDAAFGDAFALFFLAFALWTVLALMLLVGGLMGEMPRWAAILALFAHPLSGIAMVTALDSYSRNLKGAIVFVGLLPLITAVYAIWARLPALHARFPAYGVSVTAWSGIIVLSAMSLIGAMA